MVFSVGGPTYLEDAQACLDERQAQIAALVRMVFECRPAFTYIFSNQLLL
jgi:hypothetical protein